MRYIIYYIRILSLQIANYLKAKLGPRVDDKTLVYRLTTCYKCESVEHVEGYSYCKACGCPRWRDSELTRKLEMKYSTCPKKLWR